MNVAPGQEMQTELAAAADMLLENMAHDPGLSLLGVVTSLPTSIEVAS